VSGGKVELRGALGVLLGEEQFRLWRRIDCFYYSEGLELVALDVLGVLFLFLLSQHLPVLGVMLDDLIQVLMVLLLQVAGQPQILKLQLLDRLGESLLTD
jgi:hypothetical protein